MRSIEKEVFVCVDCESTGLDPSQDKIIEVAVAQFTFENIITEYETLIDPGCDIPLESQEIHHINQKMIVGKPKVAEVLPEILKMIDGHIIVGHGICFDIALLAAEAKRHQIPCKIEEQKWIDTLRLARLYGESPVNSLQSLRHHFNIESIGAHRAMNDVMINIEVFKYLVRSYKSTKQVLEVLEKPIRLRTMPLGKHKGRRFEEIPIEYLLWAQGKDFDKDLIFSIRSELKNRKRGRGFEQSASPFSSL